MSLILSKSKSLVENIPWITNEFWMSESSMKFTLQNPYHYQLQNTGIDQKETENWREKQNAMLYWVHSYIDMTAFSKQALF